MEPLPALRFAHAARVLGAAARAGGLRVPAFRSPPRIAGALRTIRWYPDGAMVAVQIRGRPSEAVNADMVEGVVVANRLDGEAAAGIRALLQRALYEGVRPEAA